MQITWVKKKALPTKDFDVVRITKKRNGNEINISIPRFMVEAIGVKPYAMFGISGGSFYIATTKQMDDGFKIVHMSAHRYTATIPICDEMPTDIVGVYSARVTDDNSMIEIKRSEKR